MSSVIVVSARSEWAQEVLGALRGDALEVRLAPTGERAIDAFVQSPADAVVVELDLPGRDGAATVESIRWAPGGERALVVLVGMDADPDRVRRVALALRARSVPSGSVAGLRTALATLARPLEAQPLTGDVTKELSVEEMIAAAAAERRSAEAPIETGTVEAPIETGTVEAPLERITARNPVDERDTDEHPRLDDQPGELVTASNRATLEAADADDSEGREVEERARVLADEARIEGDLAETSFARTLARLGELRSTGALLLSAESDGRATTTGEYPKKVVFFRNGIPLHVRSNLVEECLGQVLLQTGRIDRATLDRSLDQVRAGAGKQGAVLIAMGALHPKELREALELEQEQKLFDLFRWPAGRFRFSELMSTPADTVTLEMSMPEMVLRGVLRIPPPLVMDTVAAQIDRFPRPQEGRVPGLRRAMERDGKDFLDRIDGRTATRALLGTAPTPLAAARWLHAGECLGALTYHDEPADTAVPAAVSGLFDLRSEVRRLAMLLRDGQYAMALRVEPGDVDGASRAAAEIERAIRSELEGDLDEADLQAAAFDVLSRLPRAALVVGGDFDRPSIVPPPAAPAPPRHVTTQLPADDDWDEVTEPSVPGYPAPSSEERIDGAAGAPDPMPAEESQAELDERVSRILRAERFFRRGCRAFARSDDAMALEAFAHAVELAPEEGEFLAHLGEARRRAPEGDDAQGLDELRRAAQLVPKMELVHLWLARALRDAGELAAARDAYGNALAANPESHAALSELKALAPT